jgi:hypothetical protein
MEKIDNKPTLIIEEKCGNNLSTISTSSRESEPVYYFDSEFDLNIFCYHLINKIKMNILDFVKVYQTNAHKIDKDLLKNMKDMIDESFEYIYNSYGHLESQTICYDQLEDIAKTLLEIDVIISINASILK